jgi:hypothetical protein
MVTLTTGIIFLLFTCMYFGCGAFFEGGPWVRRPPMNEFAIDKSLRNTDIELASVLQARVLPQEFSVETSEFKRCLKQPVLSDLQTGYISLSLT